MSYIIISYVPLLTGKPGEIIDSDAMLKLADKMDDLAKNGHVNGCFWAIDLDNPQLVFAMDKGDEIAEHLRLWSDGNPEEWFNVCIAEYNGRYAVALLPDVKLSIERFKFAHETFNNSKFNSDDHFHVFFVPIIFTSQHQPMTYIMIKDHIKTHIGIHIIDMKNVDIDKPNSLDSSKIHSIGTFKIDYTNVEYLKSNLKDDERILN